MAQPGTRRRWGRAGVRLTDAEAAARDAAAGARCATREHQRARHLEIARVKWAEGLVCPALITVALDAAGLEGPEVDRACGGEEPMVDLWEAGRLYPSFEQLCALARLTGKAPGWFTWDHLVARPWSWTSLRFHLQDPTELDSDPPVRRFSGVALRAAGIEA